MAITIIGGCGANINGTGTYYDEMVKQGKIIPLNGVTHVTVDGIETPCTVALIKKEPNKPRKKSSHKRHKSNCIFITNK